MNISYEVMTHVILYAAMCISTDISVCAVDQNTGQRLCRQMELLLRHPRAMVSVSASVAVASLLFAFHVG